MNSKPMKDKLHLCLVLLGTTKNTRVLLAQPTPYQMKMTPLQLNPLPKRGRNLIPHMNLLWLQQDLFMDHPSKQGSDLILLTISHFAKQGSFKYMIKRGSNQLLSHILIRILHQSRLLLYLPNFEFLALSTTRKRIHR